MLADLAAAAGASGGAVAEASAWVAAVVTWRAHHCLQAQMGLSNMGAASSDA